MPGANRHREPSLEQLLRRVYRRQIQSDKLILELQAQIKHLVARAEINAAVVRHCKQLVLEKRTMLTVIDANPATWAALPRRAAP